MLLTSTLPHSKTFLQNTCRVIFARWKSDHVTSLLKTTLPRFSKTLQNLAPIISYGHLYVVLLAFSCPQGTLIMFFPGLHSYLLLTALLLAPLTPYPSSTPLPIHSVNTTHPSFLRPKSHLQESHPWCSQTRLRSPQYTIYSNHLSPH